MARVVLENLCKTFEGPKGACVRAVHELSLVVEDGELLALVGPSGSGKTTTLRLIAGLEEAGGGTVSIDGKVVNDDEPKDRNVAMVFQDHALYPHLTVFGNMALGLKLRKVSNADIEKRVRETAAMLDLTLCLDRFPQELSGGQRQRVALGRAIVRNPKLFLFDEPLSNLDAPLRVQMRREIADLQRRLGITSIYVTHDQAEAMALGDHVAVMNDGVIQQVARPREVYQRPANLFVAGFIGSPPMNLFHGVIVSEGGEFCFKSAAGQGDSIAVRLDGGMVPKLAGLVDKRVVLGLRAEEILPMDAETAASSGFKVEAAVSFVETLGPESHVHLLVGSHKFTASWRADSASFTRDQKLVVKFSMKTACFFDPVSGAAIV